jgi:hypothetical protein
VIRFTAEEIFFAPARAGGQVIAAGLTRARPDEAPPEDDESFIGPPAALNLFHNRAEFTSAGL